MVSAVYLLKIADQLNSLAPAIPKNEVSAVYLLKIADQRPHYNISRHSNLPAPAREPHPNCQISPQKLPPLRAELRPLRHLHRTRTHRFRVATWGSRERICHRPQAPQRLLG